MPINKKNTSLDNSVTVTNNHGIHTRLDTINQSLQDLEVNIGGDLNFDDNNITSNLEIINTSINNANVSLLNRLDQQLSVNTVDISSLATHAKQDDIITAINNANTAIVDGLHNITIENADIDINDENITSNLEIINSSINNANVSLLNRLNQTLTVDTGLSLSTLESNTSNIANIVKCDTDNVNITNSSLTVDTGLSLSTLESNTSNIANIVKCDTDNVNITNSSLTVDTGLSLSTLESNTSNIANIVKCDTDNVNITNTSLNVNTISGFNLETTQQDVLSNIVSVKNAVEGTLTVNSTIQNATLTVDGSVNVGNFPATQPVSGTISVDNFPTTQPVSGTVAISNTSFDVGNFPATQPVSGTVAVSNLPATQPVSGTVAISNTSFDVGNFPATQTVDGDVNATLKAKYSTSGDTELTCTQTGALKVDTGLSSLGTTTSEMYAWDTSAGGGSGAWDKVELYTGGSDKAIFVKPPDSQGYRVQGYDTVNTTYRNISVDANGQQNITGSVSVSNFPSTQDVVAFGYDGSSDVKLSTQTNGKLNNYLFGKNALNVEEEVKTTSNALNVNVKNDTANPVNSSMYADRSGGPVKLTADTNNALYVNVSNTSLDTNITNTSLDTNITNTSLTVSDTTAQGHLSTIATNTQKTLRQYRAEGKTFSCYTRGFTATTNYVYSVLYNPSGSGKTLYVYQITVGSNSDTNIFIGSATYSSGGTSKSGTNMKLGDATTSVATIRSAENSTITVSNKEEFDYYRIGGGSTIKIDYQENFIEIPENEGIYFENGTSGVVCTANYKWFEE